MFQILNTTFLLHFYLMLSSDKEINVLSAPLTKICSEKNPHYICEVGFAKQAAKTAVQF